MLAAHLAAHLTGLAARLASSRAFGRLLAALHVLACRLAGHRVILLHCHFYTHS